MRHYLRFIKTKRLPTTWCPGCGIGLVVKAVAESMVTAKMGKRNTVVISGIGCTGRSAGYFNLDTVHTLHGRAIPIAEGIKEANPKLNVIVLSGDGDLAGIGGNHLLHSARRGSPIKVVCVNNNIYGMTGGQVSPTTPIGRTTMSTPQGNTVRPVEFLRIVGYEGNFFARSTVFHYRHLRSMIEKSFTYKGFSFIEVISNCYPNYGKKNGHSHPYDMLMEFKKRYGVAEGSQKDMDENTLGYVE